MDILQQIARLRQQDIETARITISISTLKEQWEKLLPIWGQKNVLDHLYQVIKIFLFSRLF